MGLYTFCFIGLAPFGAFLSGTMARGLGAPLTLILGAIICLCFVGVLMKERLRLGLQGA